MWYNFDPNDRSREEFIQTLKDAHAMFQDQKNEDMRITLTEEGFILQATMTGVLDGKNISSPYCLVAKIKDGKVIRGDEYFDTAQLTKKARSAEHTSELQSLMRISYAVFCLKKNNNNNQIQK